MTFTRAACRAARLRIALVSFAFFCSLSCNTKTTDEQNAAAHTAEFADALDRLRKDDAAGRGCVRRPLIERVEKAIAEGPAAALAKETCVRAYSSLCDAEDAIFRAEALMKAEPDGGDALLTTITEVAAAEQLLQKAKLAMPPCDAAAAKFAVGRP